MLAGQIDIRTAFRTALGMSLISMLSMEIAMNLVDIWLTGGAKLTPWVVPVMLIAGFITPLPYNYWRLKKVGFRLLWLGCNLHCSQNPISSTECYLIRQMRLSKLLCKRLSNRTNHNDG